MSKRLNNLINELGIEMKESEICAGINNGDIVLPDWISVNENKKSVDLIDNETTETFQMGFITIGD